MGDQPAAAGVVGRRGGVHLDLHRAAGERHRGPGRRPGQDDVARLEGEVLGEIRDQLFGREEHPRSGVVLDQDPVQPRTDPQSGRIHGPGVDEGRTEWCVPVASLVPDVGTLVVGAQVVQPPVVSGRDPADVVPGVGPGDPTGRPADDQGDLALEGKELRACGPFDGRTARGH
ncbi:hypothetical protein SDC9_78768 [bioreactor metagenome]|uniref:Uncharacterized protein n=1 Tax=bioreactor metagenome TaxID=1076179 RepID=A0A644YW24_9ZZZZ